MNNIREKLSICLLGQISEDEALKFIKNEIKKLNNKDDIARSKVAYRTLISLKYAKNRYASWKDFCSNLRQYILFLNERISISQKLLKNIKPYLDELKMTEENGIINATNLYPSWFESNDDLKYMYKFDERKENIKSIGDQTLYKLTGHISYSSISQKLAIYKALQLKGGQTLLVSLPTGGGKSLVGQIPTLINKENKTSIVIVPTIALAIDQENSSKKFFNDTKNCPRAYHSGMSKMDKLEVIESLKKGSIPILYVSPEAILNDYLYNAVLEAAENDKIEYFIIDEAHIVLDWGEAFRPEFQFLTLLRKRLIEKSNNNLKTILLSATLSDKATKTLSKLFSQEDNFIQVRGDCLRNELMIWVDKSKNSKEREFKILDIINLLPRPMIIYVNKKRDAEAWKNKLKDGGYKSLELFTGDTSTEKREEILKQWDEEKLDIIIATSAFGMGVDKDNVRVVIHTCIPEGINRYYQEIGRAGRDGYPSVCLLSCVESEDLKDVHELTKGTVATTQNIMNRWKGIIKNVYHSQNGNEMWVDIYNAKPEHLEYETTGNINADWNKYVLLFMLRLNFIEVVDMEIDVNNRKFNVMIRITDFDLYNNEELLYDMVDNLREEEREEVNYEIESMKYLALNAYEECLSYKILDVYTQADYICGGCPNCRKEGRYPGIVAPNVKIEDDTHEYISQEDVYKTLSGSIRRYLSFNKELYIFYENNMNLLELIENLVSQGIRNIIIPNSIKEEYEKIVQHIKIKDSETYRIYTYEEIYEYRVEGILNYTTALFYDNNIEKMYELSVDILRANDRNKVIHLAKKDICIS